MDLDAFPAVHGAAWARLAALGRRRRRGAGPARQSGQTCTTAGRGPAKAPGGTGAPGVR